MKREIPDAEREWVERELSSYSGTPVESIDIIIGHLRLSFVFNIAPKDIRADFMFGHQLRESFRSIVKSNEMDRVSYDTEDMLSISEGKVKDYVRLLSQCRLSHNVRGYKRMVEKWLNLLCATKCGHFLNDWFGFLPKQFVRRASQDIVEFVRGYINRLEVYQERGNGAPGN
jgi:hypothetical protein